jgi:glycosyltransferase involved in cell wall biosynthesis
MKLSVIIPCYNGADTIAAQLNALSAQDWREAWEVLVVDNRSTDNSMEIVRSYQGRIPNLRIVDASERQGQPYALNAGAQAASGEYLAFCDADDVVGSGWVAAMGSALLKHDFVACRMEFGRLNSPWVQRTRRNPQSHGLNIYDYPKYLPHAGGGTLGVKKALFQNIGGFDETFPCLHDTVLCFKLQLAGTPLHFVPDAVMHIRFRDSLIGIFRQSVGYAEFNVLLYKQFRPLGMPKLDYQSIKRAWYGFLKEFFRIRTKAGLARWIRLLGWQYGRVKGCIKHRVFAP